MSPWEGAEYVLPGDEKAVDQNHRQAAKGMSFATDADQKQSPDHWRSKSSPTTRSTSARSIRPRTACCGW
jgi:hypothetical protein